MDKIKLEILGLSSSQSDVGHFALVLGEVDGNRRLPIIIDGYQARAIALEIEQIKPNRPMTHDLIVNIGRAFQIELLEVIITELKDGIFYARLIFRQEDGQIEEIDSRTSDAVAIGVRYKVPIFTYESVLGVAGIEVQDSDLEDMDDDDLDEDMEGVEEEEGEEAAADSPAERIRQLNVEIEKAIDAEDYERAAKLRDEISRLEGQDN